MQARGSVSGTKGAEPVEVSVAADTNKRRILAFQKKLSSCLTKLTNLPKTELALETKIHPVRGKEYFLQLICPEKDRDFFRAFLWGFACGNGKKW